MICKRNAGVAVLMAMVLLMAVAGPAMAEYADATSVYGKETVGIASWAEFTAEEFDAGTGITQEQAARMIYVHDGSNAYTLIVPEGGGAPDTYFGKAVRFLIEEKDMLPNTEMEIWAGVFTPQKLEIVGESFQGEVIRMEGDTLYMVGYFGAAPTEEDGALAFTLTADTVIPQGRDNLHERPYEVAYDPATMELFLVVALNG